MLIRYGDGENITRQRLANELVISLIDIERVDDALAIKPHLGYEHLCSTGIRRPSVSRRAADQTNVKPSAPSSRGYLTTPFRVSKRHGSENGLHNIMLDSCHHEPPR